MPGYHPLQQRLRIARLQDELQLAGVCEREQAQVFHQPAELAGFLVQDVVDFRRAGQLAVAERFGVA